MRSTWPPGGGCAWATSAGSWPSELGIDLEPELTGEFRAGDIRHCFADTARAGDLLGFTADVSIEQGLPVLADWVASQTVLERGDDAVRMLRERGLVG